MGDTWGISSSLTLIEHEQHLGISSHFKNWLNLNLKHSRFCWCLQCYILRVDRKQVIYIVNPGLSILESSLRSFLKKTIKTSFLDRTTVDIRKLPNTIIVSLPVLRFFILGLFSFLQLFVHICYISWSIVNHPPVLSCK